MPDFSFRDTTFVEKCSGRRVAVANTDGSLMRADQTVHCTDSVAGDAEVRRGFCAHENIVSVVQTADTLSAVGTGQGEHSDDGVAGAAGAARFLHVR